MRFNIDYFWFRLFKTRAIGPKRLVSIANMSETQQLEVAKILETQQPEPQNDLSARFPELTKILNNSSKEDERKVLTEYEQLKRLEVEIIYPGHPDYPPHLLEISPILFIKGQKKYLNSNSIAIVGSRNVSNKGIDIARKLAGDLARLDRNVVSGYAKGVDSEAHLGALKAKGTTTLVLPYGIKELYQKKAFKTFNWNQNILAVSQFDPSVKWLARNAMVRNKLVCALSKAVVVIESGPERNEQGKMSGTFNTAKTALKMGLPLFVLDPSCLDNPPKGNISLIELGGISLDSVNGAKQIDEQIWSKTVDAVSLAKQHDPVQLQLFSKHN